MEQNEPTIQEAYANALRDIVDVNLGVLQALSNPDLTSEQLHELHQKYVEVMRTLARVRAAYEQWEAQQSRVFH